MPLENRMGRTGAGEPRPTCRTPRLAREVAARRRFLAGSCEPPSAPGGPPTMRQVIAETARAITSTDMMNPARASIAMNAFARRVIGSASAGENAMPAVSEMYR